jgi:nitrogenase molybdenum-iron protein alpha/beta subunit
VLSNNNFKVLYIITTDVAEIIGFDANQVINKLKEKYKNTNFIYLQGQAI